MEEAKENKSRLGVKMETRYMVQVTYSKGSHLGRSEETQPELSLKDNVCQGVNKGKGETEELKEQGGANLHDK